MSLTVEALADAIASIEHWRTGPDTLAGELLPFIERHIAAGQQGTFDEQLDTLILQYGNARAVENRPGTWQQQKDAKDASADAYIKIREHLLTTPQLPKPAGNAIDGLLETARPFLAEELLTSQGYAWRGGKWVAPERPKPAGAVPKLRQYVPALVKVDGAYIPSVEESNIGQFCYIDDAIRYGDAREAAGRADAVPAVKELAAHWRQEAINAHPSPVADAEMLTHEVRRWCSGDDEWSNWQPCTEKQAAEYAKDDSVKTRARRLTGPQP